MRHYNEHIIEILKSIGFNMKKISSFNQEEYLDEWLTNNNLLTDEQLIKMYSILYDIDYFSPDYNLKNAMLYTDLSNMEPKRILILNYYDSILILLDNPRNIMNGLDMIMQTRKKYKILLTSTKELDNQINFYRVKENDILYEKIELTSNNIYPENQKNLMEEVVVSPLVQKVNYWINKAIMLRASDIHFEANKEKGRIRIRIDGKLVVMDEIKTETYDEIVSRIKVLSNLDITQKLKPQDGKIIYKFDNYEYDLRISTIPTILGEKVVVRILDKNSLNLSFNTLGYNHYEKQIIKYLLTQNNGAIIVTGPTGCGKTTTLYAYLKTLISDENNIVTIEDPVEYSIEGISQIQINSKIDLTFANLLRNILRQDPNIIMVGEIRDEETAQIAMRAAISGHLLLTTLHSNSAVGSITRLLDMEIPKYLVSSAVRAVISQRLIRKLCDKCKKKIILNDQVLTKLKLPKDGDYYKSQGCASCYYTGYKGRTLFSEILIVDDFIRELIMKEEGEQKIYAYAINSGMISLEEKIKKAAINGEISIDELNWEEK